MEVTIKRLYSDSMLPTYASETNSGMDIFAYIEGPILLHPGARKLIPTGVAIALTPGLVAQIYPERDLAVNFGVTVLDAPSLVSTMPSDEISVLLINLGSTGFVVRPNMAIAQLSIASAHQPVIQVTESGTDSVVGLASAGANTWRPEHSQSTGVKLELRH